MTPRGVLWFFLFVTPHIGESELLCVQTDHISSFLSLHPFDLFFLHTVWFHVSFEKFSLAWQNSVRLFFGGVSFPPSLLLITFRVSCVSGWPQTPTSDPPTSKCWDQRCKQSCPFCAVLGIGPRASYPWTSTLPTTTSLDAKALNLLMSFFF